MARKYKRKYSPSTQDVANVMRRMGVKKPTRKTKQIYTRMLRIDPKFGSKERLK